MDKKLETYQDLCTQYYDLDKPFLPKDEWDFYLSYATRSRGVILEPMCGTGRFLLPLLQAGFEIEGFDASEHMLAKLKKNAHDLNLQPCVWKAFIEDVTLHDRYDLIFIPAGSFNLIVDQSIVMQSLQALYAALMVGGTFVFELIKKEFIEKVPVGLPSSRSVYKKDGTWITVTSVQSPMINGVSSSLSRYTLFDGPTILHTEKEEYNFRFYTDKEIKNLLSQVGFKEIRSMKAFVYNGLPDQDDMVIIYECKK